MKVQDYDAYCQMYISLCVTNVSPIFSFTLFTDILELKYIIWKINTAQDLGIWTAKKKIKVNIIHFGLCINTYKWVFTGYLLGRFLVFLKQDRLLSSDGRNKMYEVLTERKTILYECEMCHISSWIVEILHTPFNKVKFYECKSVRKLWKCKQFTMPVAVCV